MKKKLAILLILCMTTASFFTGCSGSKSAASNGTGTAEPQVSTTAVPTETPTAVPTEAPAAVQDNSAAQAQNTQGEQAAQNNTIQSSQNKNAAASSAKSPAIASSTTASAAASKTSSKAVSKVKLDNAVKGAAEYIKKAAARSEYKINDWDAITLKSSGVDLSSKQALVNGRGYIDYKAENFIKDNSGYYLTDYARSYLGIISAGYDPSNFSGYNITDIIKNSTSKDGKFLDTAAGGEDLLNCHVWSMIALEAGKVEYNRQAALNYIESHQNKDGGFYIFSSFPQSDVDFTAMTVIALNMAGRDKSSKSVSAALNYLKKQITLLPKSANGETAETLSVILQAVVASKDDISSYKVNGRNVVDELLTFYNSDGSFKHVKSGTGNAIATRQALTALLSYKNNKNAYSIMSFTKGKFYNTDMQKAAEVEIHNAQYDAADGSVHISAKVEGADSISVDISDGVKNYSENITPKDGLISLDKAVPASNYSLIVKTMKNGNITSVLKDTIENVSKTAKVSVRVESYDKTLVKSMSVTAGNMKVYDYYGKSFVTKLLSSYTFAVEALGDSGVIPAISYDYGSPYISGIGGVAGGKFGGWDGWMYYINGKDPGVAMSDAKVQDGDELLIYYGDWGIRPLDITAAENAGINTGVTVKVTSDGKAVEGAAVYAGSHEFVTDSNGEAVVKFENTGVFEIYAQKLDKSGKPLFIRSKRINITVK